MRLRPARQTVQVVEDAGLALLQPVRSARAAPRFDAATLQAIRDYLRDTLPRHLLDPFVGAEARNASVVGLLHDVIATARAHGTPLGQLPDDEPALLALFAATLGWGPAQPYLDDPRVNEVKIVNRTVLVQEAGKPFAEAPETFATLDEVLARALNLADLLGVRLDQLNPQATVPVAHGTRVHISIPPCTEDGVLICIRRGRKRAWDLDDVAAHGSFDAGVGALLRLLARAQCSFLIAGRTNAGKTGLLEALANSWPGRPHTISIEDHTSEIGIRDAALWTREMVRSPEEFGRVAREALRQSPDLLLPGEARGPEAGAILALAMSGHPVLTTLHAETASSAVWRFASYARQPGSYLYEGRLEDALRDTCDAFQVVVRLEFWKDLGRRLVGEIALVAGTSSHNGRLEPDMVPLARLDVGAGGITWTTYAEPGPNGSLRWNDGIDRTPPMLADKLRHAYTVALAQAAAATPSRDKVAEALQRAEQHLRAGAGLRAMATMADTWRERRDPRLLDLAQQALAVEPAAFEEQRVQAQQLRAELEAASAARRWADARSLLGLLGQELALAAAVAPGDGWEQTAAAIEAGLAQHAAARRACDAAELALGAGRPRDAQAHVNGMQVELLPRDLARRVLGVREQSLAELVAAGEGSPRALQAVRAQRSALETP